MIQWFPPLTVAMVHRMLYHDSPNSIELGKIAHLQRIFLPQETIGSVAFGLGLMLKHCIKEYLEYDIKILNWFSEISLVAKSFGSDGVGKVASKRRIFRRNAGFMVHRPIWFLFLIIWATIFEETAQVKKDTRVILATAIYQCLTGLPQASISLDLRVIFGLPTRQGWDHRLDTTSCMSWPMCSCRYHCNTQGRTQIFGSKFSTLF